MIILLNHSIIAGICKAIRHYGYFIYIYIKSFPPQMSILKLDLINIQIFFTQETESQQILTEWRGY